MIVETPRLILREFEPGDWPAVLGYQSDPRYLRLYAWTARTAADVRAFVAGFVASRAAEPRLTYQLAITLRDGETLVGNCGIRLAEPGVRIGDLGYELSPEHWGRGYATEAARAMLEFAFAELQLHRVWAECVPENGASRGVLEKLGMRREGCLRQTQWYKGRWWDTLVYGILEAEWSASVLAISTENTCLPTKTST